MRVRGERSFEREGAVSWERQGEGRERRDEKERSKWEDVAVRMSVCVRQDAGAHIGLRHYLRALLSLS